MLHQKKIFDLPLSQIFFVGDLHGRYSLLMNALKDVKFDPQRGDQLICTGDLIDGGTENEKVLALLDEPWFHSVLGNHDDFFLKTAPKLTAEKFSALREWMIEEQGIIKIREWVGSDKSADSLHNLHPDLTESVAYWIYNGGAWFFDTYKTLGFAKRLALHDQVKSKSLPLALTIEANGKRFGVAHAFVPGRLWENEMQSLTINHEQVMYDRDAFLRAQDNVAEMDRLHYTFDDLDAAIFGHNIVAEGIPMIRGNTCYMDIGAKMGRKPVVWNGLQVMNAIKCRHRIVERLSIFSKRY